MNLLFHNKGIDYINLPRILNNKAVTQKIPEYFNHKLSPCISYKYTSTIAGKIFNHKRACAEYVKSTGPDAFPCLCQSNQQFIHPNIGHVVTGDLSIVKNQQLRNLLQKGPRQHY